MIIRHNNLREENGEFQKEVYHDVKVEPMLIPIEGENTQIEGACKDDGAHPDISSRGLRIPNSFERTFYDIQIVHPNSTSYIDTNLVVVLAIACAERKEYDEEVQCSCLTSKNTPLLPNSCILVLHLEDGAYKLMHSACHKRLADEISKKTKKST